MKDYRIEHDSIGDIKVDDNKYWGAQTERSFENFRIGIEKMPESLIRSMLYLKKACAEVNCDFSKLDETRKNAIVQACNELLAGALPGNFPLAVWQTGSGTQTNMNVNEVVANRATEILNGDFRFKDRLSKEEVVHPNDQVNMSQSSNDTFPTALHIMTVLEVTGRLLPAVKTLREALNRKAEEFKDLIKIGRTHLQDATPLTLGQEFSGYVSMLDHNAEQINAALRFCRELAIGGTAVGTGLNSPFGFGTKVCEKLTAMTGEKFVSEPNKFHALTSQDGAVFMHGALKSLAANLMKIANDIRWLGSGPRCGLGEINLPANEPGSSIMPGKVNPTQSEAMTMVAVQVMGNDNAVGIAASQGNFELNVFLPLIAYNLDQSIRLLSDAQNSFAVHCIEGITVNSDKLKENVERSLMLITALAPLVGYENAAKVAKKAYKDNISLKQAALDLGVCDAEEFESFVNPSHMLQPGY